MVHLRNIQTFLNEEADHCGQFKKEGVLRISNEREEGMVL